MSYQARMWASIDELAWKVTHLMRAFVAQRDVCGHLNVDLKLIIDLHKAIVNIPLEVII